MRNHAVSKQATARSRPRGQALVEFALIVPVLLAMLLGIIEFGWLIKNNLTIANAARDGARAAALGKSTTEIKTRIKNEASPVTVTDSEITLQHYAYGSTSGPALSDTTSGTTTTNNATSGELIKVTVKVPHKQLTGFFPFLKNRANEADVVMRRE